MRRMIYNTQGTGISKKELLRLENTQPSPGTYLGDEIMLLDGLEQDGLAGMGFVRAGNYRSRASMDGFSVSLSALPQGRGAGRDFEPWGLGAAPSPKQSAPPQTFFQAHEMEARLEAMPSPESLSPPGTWLQGVGGVIPTRATRPDRFIGPHFYPLEELPSDRRSSRDFSPWGLGGLESAAQDRATALSIAQATRSACRLACTAINESTPALTSQRRSQCQAGCDAAYSAAEAAINAAYPAGTSGPAAPDQQAIIAQKLDQLQRQMDSARRQADSGRSSREGLSTTQWALIGAGVLGAGFLAIIALRGRK